MHGRSWPGGQHRRAPPLHEGGQIGRTPLGHQGTDGHARPRGHRRVGPGPSGRRATVRIGRGGGGFGLHLRWGEGNRDWGNWGFARNWGFGFGFAGTSAAERCCCVLESSASSTTDLVWACGPHGHVACFCALIEKPSPRFFLCACFRPKPDRKNNFYF